MSDRRVDRAQEDDLTLWADQVARNMDDEGHSDLADLFRSLVRRDEDGLQEALAGLDCW